MIIINMYFQFIMSSSVYINPVTPFNRWGNRGTECEVLGPRTQSRSAVKPG